MRFVLQNDIIKLTNKRYGVIAVFTYIKGLFNKKEVARIKELEQENEKLQEQLADTTKELEEVRDCSVELYLKLQSIEELEEEVEYEKCSCGGYMMPMYDEHPNWIKFCSMCDSRSEDSDMSPVLEPA